MGDTILVGGLSLNKVWLSYAVGGLLSYFLFRKKDQNTTQILMNIVIIIALFWRFGSFLFNPGEYLNKPMLFIQAYGGRREIITGIIVSIFYLMIKNNRSSAKVGTLLDIAVLGSLVILAVKNLLVPEFGIETSLPWGVSISNPAYIYHPINDYRLIWIVSILILLWKLRFSIGQGKYFAYGLFFWGLGNMLISNLLPKQNLLLLLSTNQWVYFLGMLIGVMTVYKVKRSKIEIEKKSR